MWARDSDSLMPCGCAKTRVNGGAVLQSAARPIPLPATIADQIADAMQTWAAAILEAEAWLKTQPPGPARHQTAQRLRVQTQFLLSEERHAVL